MIDLIIDSIKGEVGRMREAYKDIAMHYAIEPPQGVKKKEWLKEHCAELHPAQLHNNPPMRR